ncbi:MAG: sugar kinase, partial [Arenimonas sp.]
FPSRASQASMIFGEIENGNTLRVRSQMPEGGIIFSDGMAADGLEFRSGLEASISIAEQRGHLLH